MTEVRPVRSPALGGVDIGRCLTRLHHDRFTPAARVADDVRDRAIAGGIAFEARVFEVLHALGHPITDVAPDDAEGDTLRLLEAGAPFIAGARLSADDGRLVGYPDLLVRLDGGYAPVDVKHHKVVGDSGPAGIRTPLDRLPAPVGDEVRFRGGRRRDLLQVAHYRHLLGTLGHASDEPIGGIVGTEEPLGCVWVDLHAGEVPVADDHASYLVEADRAIRHGLAGHDEPLVAPWLRGECRRCDWRAWCVAELEAASDPTLLRDIDAGVRAALAHDGVRTIEDVARLDPTDERLPEGGTVLQARARVHGSLLRPDPTGTSMDLPGAPTEIDFDIETYRGSTYLAGLLVTHGEASHYEAIVDWRGDADGERDLLGRLFERLGAWDGESFVVYHWTDYEQRLLVSAAERYGLSIAGHDDVEEWFDAHAVDLCAWARRHLVSPNGFSLKTIAPLCGFSWRDDDPGGLQSEIWFERLGAGDGAMAARLLTYNEDDVRAQLAVRRWVRSHDSGAGPGSGIASALDTVP